MSIETTWLDNYLAADSRNLKKPDGRPLYAYAMETSEFKSLAELLPNCRKQGRPSNPFVLGTEWLFVIYAAEWWRRKYKGGAWKWEDVFLSIDWPDISFQQRQRLTRKGLDFWERNVFRHESGSSAYLMSIVTEGGFPMRLAEREGTHLSRYLRAILNDYAKYQSAGMTADRIAKSHEQRLPVVFRKEAVFHLAALTIEAIFELSEEIGDTDNPYDALELNVPGWKNRLPLPVESEGAKALVNGLLRNAKARRKNRYERLSLRRQFEKFEDGLWRHVAYIELPESIPAGVLAEQLGRSMAELPRRLEIAVHAEGNFTKVAALSRESDEYIVYAYSLGNLTLPIEAVSDVACVIMQAGSGRIGDLMLVGGDGLDPELPTTCCLDGDVLVVVGQGGLRSRLDKVYVSIPADMSIVGENENQSEDIRTEGFHEDATWFCVTSPLEVRVPGGFTCLIVVGANSDSATGCIVAGQRAYLYEPPGFSCYLGFPKIFESGEARLSQIPAEQIHWAPHDRVSSWSKVSEDPPIGLVKIRVIREGSCIFSGRFAVLPAEFSIDLRPGSTTLEGNIYLTGLGEATIAPKQHLIVSFDVVRNKTHLVIQCRSLEPFSGKLPVDVLWPNGSNCPVLLPFPGEGANFVQADGARVDSASISMTSLVSTSAISVTNQSHKSFLVHGTLQASDIQTFKSRGALSFSRDLTEISDGYYELKLVDIFVMVRDLFSYSADLDARVRLEIYQGSTQKAMIDITQFDSQLKFEPDNLVICHLTNDFEDNPESLDIQFIPLGGEDSPTIESHILVGEAYGWQLDDGMTTSCTSLAMAKGVRARTVRPCVVYFGQLSNESAVNDDFDSLNDIFLISDLITRTTRLSAFLSRIASDPLDEGWYQLVGAIRRYADVHPDSLDVYSAIIDEPLVAAGLFVRLTEADLRILLDWQDYLPFRWWQIPISIFDQAINDYQTVVDSRYQEHATVIFQAMIRNFFKIAEEMPLMQPTVNALLNTGSDGSEGATNHGFDPVRAYEKNLSQDLLRDLFSSHGNDNWPQGMAREEWSKIFQTELPWLNDGGAGAGFRRPFIDAVIAQGYSIAAGHYLNRDARAYVCAIREFDSTRFDQMLQLTTRIFHEMPGGEK